MYMCKGIHEEGHPGSWCECSYRGLDTAHYFTDYCNYFDKDCVEISIRRINVAILRRTGKARGKGPLGGCEFWVQWMTQETKKVPGDRCWPHPAGNIDLHLRDQNDHGIEEDT